MTLVLSQKVDKKLTFPSQQNNRKYTSMVIQRKKEECLLLKKSKLGWYSGIPNNHTVGNKRTGWGIFPKIHKRTGLSYLVLFCKAKLQKEGIFFPHPIICQRHFINEKVGNRRN